MKAVWIFIVALFLPGLPAMAQDIRAGEETYLRYCATCHGLDASGHGPMRSVLTVQPADLTRLTAENGGVFPLFRVVQRIDGRDPLVAHGSPMPIYGDLFEGRDTSLKTDAGQPVMTSRPVADLVAYIRTLQVE
ncbi:c-type cytochrome [Roseovarius aestuarii]|uniref:Cytochrome c n=2 Tax=Roseovarius aestuarii TaxID=475083 RepID=A0A1X7BKZ7_9RHOB|nr:c-type cytochrome [Roseovarius aestuarii]SMC10327.1 Cytochrome c [Roseovarius aestuarii]